MNLRTAQPFATGEIQAACDRFHRLLREEADDRACMYAIDFITLPEREQPLDFPSGREALEDYRRFVRLLEPEWKSGWPQLP